MLQGQNGWMTKRVKDGNETAKEYQNKIIDGHSEQLKDNSIPS
jgi:hypothetical protein